MCFSIISFVKRIDVMIPTLRKDQVMEAILKAGAQGVTIGQSQGKDTGDKPLVREQRGLRTYIAKYNRFHTITAIVNDAKLADIVSVIMDEAYTGSKQDGGIFVSTVDEAFSIGNKERFNEKPVEEALVSQADIAKFVGMSDSEKKKWIINKAKQATQHREEPLPIDITV